ncbi:hypothetical protein KGF45_13755 [Clostridioides sp. ZZV14-6154]|uniref:DUF6442 family protein n=1 Tax=unclassified Clostridioides TaxID=2635829 RepID=UPI001D116256|nr:hypothetical protein [Clostridioides sp. ZZV15-6388]MCC0661341.1 hypothetical protein [Clostridioides sp. ZZV14-6154]MCC0669843.1 hypothetical protein [Clostridioides sp. ZZV14-6153]MCC0727756.1 hypothetical protein [Clostridioides sp. ZZV14-6045]MCC0732344.1 hypothetical protein [Clostridioides sp. ZZV14-6048]MCC0736211.1 hypothetical protein [Clostridioides sp. ZZV14-6009]MCC0740304.1 hypothetical protein [Clostridioides sp. ZZV14-5902]WLD26819.1 hypothetical protein CDIFMA2_06910 [Clos
MNKEEILKKSRQSNNDEGIKYIQNKGRSVGYFVFCCIYVFIILFNAYVGQESYAASSLFWAFLAAETISKYPFTHKKSYIIVGIIGTIGTIFSLINFVLLSLR